jgi:hypothetical protein
MFSTLSLTLKSASSLKSIAFDVFIFDIFPFRHFPIIPQPHPRHYIQSSLLSFDHFLVRYVNVSTFLPVDISSFDIFICRHFNFRHLYFRYFYRSIFLLYGIFIVIIFDMFIVRKFSFRPKLGLPNKYIRCDQLKL